MSMTDTPEDDEWIDETKVFDHTEREYALLDSDAQKGDVRYGTRYWARVNNVEPYGVFVTLAESVTGDWDDEVSGLVHESKIPNLYSATDFAVDDEVGVMLYERKDNGDISFEMVAALNTMRNIEFENDPLDAPDEQLAPAFNRPADEGHEAATADADDSAGDETPETAEADSEARGPPDDDVDVEVPSVAEAIAADVYADDDSVPSSIDYSTNEQSLAYIIGELISGGYVEPPNAAPEVDIPAVEMDAPEELDELLAEVKSLNATLGERGGAYTNLVNRLDAISDAVSAQDDADPEWPGQYSVVVGLLRNAAADGRTVSNIDYDEANGEATLTVRLDR